MLFLVLILFILLTLTACRASSLATPDLACVRDTSFANDLFTENEALRAENAQLRELLLANEQALLAQNTTLSLFIDRLRAASEVHARAVPGARINTSAIQIYGSSVVINVSGAVPILLADTHSMEPVASSSSKVIALRPNSACDIGLGDIIGFRSPQGIILHRVIGVGSDAQGVYYLTRGDNTPRADPVKVRFSDVETVVVGIIY